MADAPKNRTAVITGAGSGIGQATAVTLAGMGFRVAIVGRDPGKLEATRALINREDTLVESCDVADRASVDAMSSRVLQANGGVVEVLVSNAGVNVRRPIDRLEEAEWDHVLHTNLKGPWLCCRAVAAPMKERRWGRVINLSSIMGEVSLPERTLYASSKGGLTMLTKTLALEWAPFGINVNALCPGPFATEMNLPLLNDPKAREAFSARVPLNRWADPVELGPAAVFLASEASSFVTGTCLYIDGGYTAQ